MESMENSYFTTNLERSFQSLIPDNDSVFRGRSWSSRVEWRSLGKAASIASLSSVESPVQGVSGLNHLPLAACGRADAESDEEGLMCGMEHLKQRLRTLERKHADGSGCCADRLPALKRATATYTNLLRRGAPPTLAASGGNSLDTTSVGELSEIERARYSSSQNGSSLGPDNRRDEPLNRSLDLLPDNRSANEGSVPTLPTMVDQNDHFATPNYPIADLQLNLSTLGEGSPPTQQLRALSVDLSSGGESVKLNERQRSRLQQYRQTLDAVVDRETINAKALLGSSESQPTYSHKHSHRKTRKKHNRNERTQTTETNSGNSRRVQNERTQTDQLQQTETVSRRATVPQTAESNAMSRQVQTDFDAASPSLDFHALRQRLAQLRRDCVESGRSNGVAAESVARSKSTNVLAAARLQEQDSSTQEKRLHSDPGSPIRHVETGKKHRVLLEDRFRPLPFVAAKSTGVSYSLGVNVQQVLGLLKTQNPLLRQVYLRLGPSASTPRLVAAFRAELLKNMRRLDAEVELHIRNYEKLTGELSKKRTDKKRTEEAKHEQADMAELKYHSYLRLAMQYQQLVSFATDVSGNRHISSCRKSTASDTNRSARSLSGPPKNQIRRHTVSSLQRSVQKPLVSPTVSGQPPHHSADTTGKAAQMLRGLQSLQGVLNNRV